GGDQSLGKLVDRATKNRRHCALFDYLTAAHHDHAVGKVHEQRGIMGDEEKAEIFLAAKVGQQYDDFRLDGGIERGGGFVGNHHSRRASQRLGDQDALCFSAAQLVRISVENAARVRQLDLGEQCCGFVAQAAPTPTVM